MATKETVESGPRLVEDTPTTKTKVFKNTSPVTDLTVVTGRRAKAGEITDVNGRAETIFSINGDKVMITGYEEKVKEKTRATKDDDGNIIGFEPTGEKELTIKMSWIENP